MAETIDDDFYKRTDAHIHLSNDQLVACPADKVSVSMTYAAARFNIWVTACKAVSGEEMEQHRSETIDYFVQQYRLMLEDHHNDYSRNFSSYMPAPQREGG